MDFKERSDWQLLRVSRGAHELAKMVDSWSKSSNADPGHQKYIVNDLLRGTMELQESVLMLSRLQEDSRRISMMKMMRRGGEEEDEVRPHRLQEHRFSADGCSTNCVQEMRQVVRNRMCKFNDENASSTEPLVVSKGLKKMKAPNLVARLMGLEDLPSPNDRMEVGEEEKITRHKNLDEIIETMRSIGALKSEKSISLGTNSVMMKSGENSSKKSSVPPIVIMRPQHLPYKEREEENLVSETYDLLLEDDNGCMEPSSKMDEEFKKDAPSSQKQLKGAGFFDKKKTDDAKRIEVNRRKQGEKKVVKSNGATKNMDSASGIKYEKRQATTSFTAKKRKDNLSTTSASSDSIRERISADKPIRNLRKPGDKKLKDGKLSCQTENLEISRSRSISASDGLLKLVQKEPTKPFLKDSTRKGHKMICEVMPRNFQTRSLAKIERSIRKLHSKPTTKNAEEIKFHLKPLLLSSQSFCNLVHDLYGAPIFKPAFCHATFLEEQETVHDRLMLDSAKELIARKTHQMRQNRMRNRPACRSFSLLVDELSKGIEKLESFGEFELEDDGAFKDYLDAILEKDLHCKDAMLNAIWDDWDCVEEAGEPVAEMVEQIVFGLLLEATKDLITSEKRR